MAEAEASRLPIRPSRRAMRACALTVLVAALYAGAMAFAGAPAAGAWAVVGAVALAFMVDGVAAWRLARRLQTELDLERRLPHALALGVERAIVLRVINRSRHRQQIQFTDSWPDALVLTGLPASARIEAEAGVDFPVRITPIRRGAAQFERAEVLADSALGLWQAHARIGSAESIRVFPNFAAVAKFALLATDHRLSRLGVKLKRRRGEGMEFHQLREYRAGDSLRQIDWKASTRRQKLISREYQDERDQRLVFMLDSSRRMRSQDGDITHFDQALNSMMLLAHVALKQGDSVGAISFGGDERSFAPGKGTPTLDALTNAFYDVEPRAVTGDYLAAATRLMKDSPKRSMVVILTNLRDEDEDELGMAIRVLSAKHLVVVASLRETVLGELAGKEVSDLTSALAVAATDHYLEQRGNTFARLTSRQSHVLDVEPARLPIALVNQYLAIKRSGRL
jgi:uncharacterized protein (DUF58 family)